VEKKLDMKMTMGDFYDTCELLSLAVKHYSQEEWKACEKWSHDIAEQVVKMAHEAGHGNVGLAMIELFLAGAVSMARIDAEYIVECEGGESDGD